ncbi:hypothetical protein DL769_010472 [Monosporascus sp. CRB-8-3]|nr:hypothetical protein DL769_010472 [Monosporascus sp. CRB-8-3]
MSITLLAPELLRQILSHLGEGDYSRASLVCRDWLLPCRELYWGHINLYLGGHVPEKFPPVLRNKNTTIPRHLGGIVIDESDEIDDRDEKEAVAWYEGVSAVLDHFNSISSVTIRYLDLKEFQERVRGKILRPGIVKETLVIQRLIADKPSDVVPFILGSPSLKFLGLGEVSFSDENTEAAHVEQYTVEPIKLAGLGHLAIFGESKGTWSELVPRLMQQAPLESLKTLVVACQDNKVVAGLIKKAELSLRSLALGFKSEGSVFDLANAKLLQNLSIDLTSYPKTEILLSDLVQTVSSVSKLERIFINCGPSTVKPTVDNENDRRLWGALDLRLSQLPGLEKVTFTMVIDRSVGMFLGFAHGRMKDMLEKWKDDVLQYALAKLPSCRERDLIQVVQVFGSWTEDHVLEEPKPTLEVMVILHIPGFKYCDAPRVRPRSASPRQRELPEVLRFAKQKEGITRD